MKLQAVAGCSILVSVIAGCATYTPVREKPPEGWIATASAGCSDIAGSYSAQGVPAVGNANADFFAWPAMGSLVSMAAQGSNGMPYSSASYVRITADSEVATFAAFDRDHKPQPLAAREWRCSNGALETRATLGGGGQDSGESTYRDESLVRLWKSADGALIAENTIESEQRALRSSARHIPIARFYFRFAPVQPAGGGPSQ
jgi:hypothetical protein